MNKIITKIRHFQSLVLLLILSFSPVASYASDLFPVSSGDISIKTLGAIFGGLLNSGGDNPLLSSIKSFNGGILIIGGVLAAYTILAGTLGTAHDGEVLGKKFSSMWIPIRYGLGTALVLPVVGGGYCVMQAIVMWLIVQGIGLADNVWTAFMSDSSQTGNTTTSVSTRASILNAAESAFANSVCVYSFQQVMENNNNSVVGKIMNWVNKYNYQKVKNPDGSGYIYGDQNSVVNSGCGTISYPQIPSASSTATVSNSTPSTNSGFLGPIDTIFSPLDTSSINQAEIAQTDALVNSMDALAKQAVQNATSMNPATAQNYWKQIQSATDSYVNNISTTANGLAGQNGYSLIQASSSNQGWMLAGAWFTRLIQMNQQIYDAINLYPTGSRSSPSIDKVLFSDSTKYLNVADMVLSQDPNSANSDVFNTNQSSENSQTAQSPDSKDANVFESHFEQWILNAISGVNLMALKNDPRHPLIILQDLGNRLETAMWTMAVAGSLGAFGLSISVLGSGVGLSIQNAMTFIGWFVDFPMKLLGAAAYGAEYILPNIPLIIWVGCVTGWVLLVIEAIIAAPIWAIMHLHPSGDDLTGRGGNGYSLVLSLLLRPVLMIFGLEASLTISYVIGEFINKIYFESFVQNTGATSGLKALSGLAVGTILYEIIMVIFIRKCFGLIHQLPDQILTWIGGPTGSSLGQFAGEFASAADKGSGAAAALSGAVASVPARGVGSVLSAKVRSDDFKARQSAKLNQQREGNDILKGLKNELSSSSPDSSSSDDSDNKSFSQTQQDLNDKKSENPEPQEKE